jgi:hypothetical protein
MARRSNTETKPAEGTTEAPEEAAVSTATTEPVTEPDTSTADSTELPTTDGTQAGAASTDGTTTETAPKPAATEADLTAFKEAVQKALPDRDETTGELPVASIEPVQAEYRKIEGVKGKNAARKLLDDAVIEAMNALDMSLARANMILRDSMSAGSGKSESKPVDPTEAFVQRVAGLRLADRIAEQAVPEGVAEDWATKAAALVEESADAVNTYTAWLNSTAEDKGDEPEVPAIVKAAVKLAQGKTAKVGTSGRTGGGSASGERHDIGKHIEEAFADVAPDTFLTVAEIRNHKSTEYGDNPPSAGAISARLFPSSGKCTIEGITPDTNDKGNKGARKNAA